MTHTMLLDRGAIIDVEMVREVRLVNDELGTHVFEFFLGTPDYWPERGEFRCEFGVSGLLGVADRRTAYGFDAMAALMSAMDGLNQIANCIVIMFEADETDFETDNGIGLPFRRMPDLQMGMKLARSADFRDAPRFLLPYAADGSAEAQFNMGTCLLLTKWGDQLTAQLAFEWFEKAALQGVGQAYWYMADIVERHPGFRADLLPAAYYFQRSEALGYYPMGDDASLSSAQSA